MNTETAKFHNDRAPELAILLKWAVHDVLKDAKQPALFLSGGLDSAIISKIAEMNRLKHTYCVTWPDTDNISMARVADPFVREVTFTREQLVEVIPTIAQLTGGKGTWSQVCQWFLAKAAAEDGCDVVLTGEGSDEIFGGYGRYRVLRYIDEMMTDPLLEEYQGFVKRAFGFPPDADIRDVKHGILANVSNRTLVNGHSSSVMTGSLTRMAGQIEGGAPLAWLLEHERKIITQHVEECRYAFTDPRVVAFAAEQPEETKFDSNGNKALLREAAKLLGVHGSIVHEKTKKGLFVPQSWRPEGAPMWSSDWFNELMREAHAKAA